MHPLRSFRPFFTILCLLCFLFVYDACLYFSGSHTLRPAGFFSYFKKPAPKKPLLRNYPAASLLKEKNKNEKDTAQAVDKPDTLAYFLDFSDSSAAFTSFFTSIQKHKRKLRLGYFGDSMIEGDLLTQDLRRLFQQWLGGAGVGFVPVTSAVSGFRQSIRHRFSDNWQQNDISESYARNKFSPGPGGFMHQTGNAEAWVEFARGNPAFSGNISLRLWYGPQKLPGTLSLDHAKKIQQFSLNDTLPFSLNTLTDTWNGNLLRCSFSPPSGPIYGFSCESDTGIILDNFSFRGNSGMALTRIPFKTWQAFARAVPYDLLIFHYGLNVVSEASLDYAWYYRGMSKVLSLMRRAFPGVPILIVGVSDKGYRTPEGEFATVPGVYVLDSIQYRMAKENKTAFYSLFSAMGGEGSMVSMVNRPYPLANKDFTHLNNAGARMLAQLMFNDFKKKYAQWMQANHLQ